MRGRVPHRGVSASRRICGDAIAGRCRFSATPDVRYYFTVLTDTLTLGNDLALAISVFALLHQLWSNRRVYEPQPVEWWTYGRAFPAGLFDPARLRVLHGDKQLQIAHVTTVMVEHRGLRDIVPTMVDHFTLRVANANLIDARVDEPHQIASLSGNSLDLRLRLVPVGSAFGIDLVTDGAPAITVDALIADTVIKGRGDLEDSLESVQEDRIMRWLGNALASLVAVQVALKALEMLTGVRFATSKWLIAAAAGLGAVTILHGSVWAASRALDWLDERRARR